MCVLCACVVKGRRNIVDCDCGCVVVGGGLVHGVSGQREEGEES